MNRSVAQTYKIIILGVIVISALIAIQRINLTLPLHDFVEYWSAGQLNLKGLNPYDPALMIETERLAGWNHEWSLMMWNPPWVLPVLMPLSLLDYSQSRFVWFILSVSIFVFCINQAWIRYQGSPKFKWIGLLTGLSFTPTLLTLMLGQITPLILLGILGFLIFIDKPQSLWIAGAWVSLITIKPQLFYLFWIVFILWLMDTKHWQALAGSIVTVTIGLVIATIFNPSVLFQYINAVLHHPPANLATPTFGYILRLILGFDHFWLQFLPPVIGIIWVLLYWRGKRSSWSWWNDMPIVLFVSIITSSYTWNHDQIILLPALIQAVISLQASKNHWKPFLVLVFFILINYADFFIHQHLDESWMIWMGPLLLGLYWYSLYEKPYIRISFPGAMT